MKKINLKQILFIFLFMLFLLLINSNHSFASSQYLNNLNYSVEVNDNGSMNVVETWDIDISQTNTLFKTFKPDSSKYSGISNVKVKYKTNNGYQYLRQINEEMYHVTDGCFYALTNSSGLFEIAWNVGLDNSSDTRTYQISYTVDNVIGKYNDCDELYWQFLGSDFSIDAKQITGTITLPKSIEHINNLRVWGHTKYLNGETKIIDNKSVSFKVDNFESGTYVEIRLAIPSGTVSTSNRTYNTDQLDNIISEETNWANEANSRRDAYYSRQKALKIISIILAVLFALFLIYLCIKNFKKLKELKKVQFKPDMEIKYFRDLPNSNTTPAESVFLTSRYFESFPFFGNVFASTILDLTLKGYLTIDILENNPKKKENILITYTNKEIENLSSDETMILDFIINSQTDKKITLKSFENYVTAHPSKISKLQSDFHSEVKKQQVSKGNFVEEKHKELNKYTLYLTFYIAILFFTWMIPGVNILIIINLVLTIKITKSINIFTQEAVNESARWKGLKKYMEDFSLLKEKEVPELVIWEHFLVYATAFGIADKVIKQLSIVYPNFQSSDVFTSGSYMYLMANSNFANTFSNSIASSINTSYSSGSGAGGGFSGGGGGGRWSVVGGGGR